MDFYVLLGGRAGSRNDTEMLEADPVHLGDAPTCEVCRRFIGSRPWLPPYRVGLTLRGAEWGDFAFRVGDETEFLLSERAAGVIRAEDVQGLSEAAVVEGAHAVGSHVPPPAYFQVAVARIGVAIDEESSRVIRSRPPSCSRCLSDDIAAIHGFRLEADTWTGEDVFIARGLPGGVIASRRFRQIIARYGLTNVRFTRTESYEWVSTAPESGTT
jgi:hypothetical protein